MAQTRFTGPVVSDNGFEGSVSATVLTSASATVTNLLATSATITNLLATTLTIGSTKITSGSAVSGAVSAQLGYIPVMVGATTAYIGLYKSLTL